MATDIPAPFPLQDGAMIGRLEKPVINCQDPGALAAFYAQLLGMRVNEHNSDWVVIGREPGLREIAFQRDSTWTPPPWPPLPTGPLAIHLDIRVDDIDAAEPAVLSLGARRLPAQRETGFRVYADPEGHPFCLVFGRPKKSRGIVDPDQLVPVTPAS